MNNEFITFRKFADREAANEFAEALSENDIEYIVEQPKADDPLFSVNNDVIKELKVKLRLKDFEKADELLTVITERQIDIEDKDYYLQSFTDEELKEVVTKPDEWNKYDYLLAQKILAKRGKEINPEKLKMLRKQRLDDLSKPEKPHNAYILRGYVRAPFGGFVAIFIGYDLAYTRKTLPNGEKVYAYSDEDREHGIRIFYIGIIAALIWIAAWVIFKTKN